MFGVIVLKKYVLPTPVGTIQFSHICCVHLSTGVSLSQDSAGIFSDFVCFLFFDTEGFGSRVPGIYENSVILWECPLVAAHWLR